MKKPGSYKDLYLMPGDSLVIPVDMQTVKITGAVAYPTTVPYLKGKGVRAYVNRSGGFGSDAKPSRVYVINANGSVNATKPGFLFIHNFPKIEPGATIVVPKKK
jgi:protein involved in polysaccharide export with SLBB domain